MYMAQDHLGVLRLVLLIGCLCPSEVVKQSDTFPVGAKSLKETINCHPSEFQSGQGNGGGKIFSTRLRLWASIFSFLNRWIILWIELPWTENLANAWARHMETLDNYFNLFGSHQQCIPWSPPLDIEPATTECSAETLPVSHLST